MALGDRIGSSICVRQPKAALPPFKTAPNRTEAFHLVCGCLPRHHVGMATQTKSPKSELAAWRVAALTVALSGADTAAGEIQLFPAGEFRTTDGSGRPEDVDAWRMDSDIATALIAQVAAAGRDIVIDYEHQTLAAQENGQPAPAAGWIRELIWRDGQGLYAAVDWTARAREFIANGEYRYISPVFPYDKTGRPLDVLHVALTNYPALTGMDEVRLAAASRLAALIDFQPREEIPMDALLKALFALLGLSEDASEEEALAKLGEFAERVKATEVKVEELTAEEQKKDEEIAALKAQPKIDPARWVPAQVVADLQKQVNELSATHTAREVDEVVTAALAAKKLTPALEPWARDLGKQNIAALRAFVDQAAPIAALTGQQTAGVKVGDKTVALDESELAVCRALGISPEAWAKQQTKQQGV